MNDEKSKKRRKASKWFVWLAPAIALAPAIIGGIGARLTPGCNESNCSWGVIPWYTFFTMPLGMVLLVIGLVIKPNDQLPLESLPKANLFK